MGFARSYAAAAGADALRQIQQDRLAEKDLKSVIAQRIFEQMQRQADAAERTRQFEASHALAKEQAAALAEQRRASAAKSQADAEAEAARTAELNRLTSDPNALAGLTPLQRLLTLNRLRVANVGIHDLEQPTEHSAHLKGDRDAEFAEWKRRTDYSEGLQRSRPQVARIVVDDPTLPRGVQDYLVQLRAKYPSFEAAAGEFSSALGSLRSAHPNLSSTKALDALRRQFTGSGGSGAGDEIDALIEAAMGGDAAAQPSGGRGGGPGAPARIVGARAGAPAQGGARGTVSLAELEAIARKRGTSVEQERQRATASGFIVR